MANAPLIVPIDLEVLNINHGVHQRDTFRWWQFNYLALKDFKSPEPMAGGNNSGSPEPGIHLHWTLPRALRHGAQNSGDSAVDYPLVPNRWLIVRFVGGTARKATAWVVESDCPFSSKTPSVDSAQTSLYLVNPDIINAWKASSDPKRNSTKLDPSVNEPQIANIGVSFPLANWKEQAPSDMFLTAVAPANASFSVYYPQNIGVFSFYDSLKGIDQDTVSYLAVGWYSDSSKDIMASWKSSASPTAYSDLLEKLKWTVAGSPPDKASASLYQGMAFAIPWQRNGNPPDKDPLQAIRNSGDLDISVGNTTIDAFGALAAKQLQAAGHPSETINMLKAFNYGLLPVINEVNGSALLKRKVRQAWYGSKPGGYSWDIVPKESDGETVPDLTAAEAAWLLQLNKDQAALDEALAELQGLQWRFNSLWWKLGLDPDDMFPESPPGVTNAKLQHELDPKNMQGISSQVIHQLTQIEGMLSKVPRPSQGVANTQQAFQEGILAFAEKKALSKEKILKAVAAPRLWKANNPVVVVSGVEPAPAVNPNSNLTVRSGDALVTGFDVKNATVNTSTATSAIPAVADLAHIANWQTQLQALIHEYVFLDPANAAAIAKAISKPETAVAAVMSAHSASVYKGTLPEMSLDNWSQPWKPVFMEWKANYAYVPHQTSGNGNWTFDGTDYHFTPQGGAKIENRDVGGISILSPHAQFVFGARLKEFVTQFGSETQLKQLEEWIEQIGQWKYLAQELTNFNEWLAMHDHRAFRRPTTQDNVGSGNAKQSAAALAGFENESKGLPAAHQGGVGSVPFLPNGPDIPFHGVRQGQVYFETLFLYDNFGRILHVVAPGADSGLFDAKNFPLVRDAAMLPAPKINPNIAAAAQLPPRLLQHGRLDFSLIDGKTDQSALETHINPIAGWVLPNHLDRSVSLYAPGGAAMGEYGLVETPQGNKTGGWRPPPHQKIKSLADVAKQAPHLAQLLGATALKTEANFNTFLQVIDDSLWTVDPLGNRADQNLSVLIGRPLALVRTRLQFRLDGPALQASDWAATFTPPKPAFPDFKFAIRLGDQATRRDGVIGYFIESDYNVFNSVAAPQTTAPQSYVHQIGPLGEQGGQNYLSLSFNPASSMTLTLLVDPRAGMHAISGILPAKEVTIPARFVNEPLNSIEVSFQVGPVLTSLETTPAQGDHQPAHAQSIHYPFPTEQNGTWSWWEKVDAPANWQGFDLHDATHGAKLDGLPKTLREGYLQLVLNLHKK